MLYKQSKQLNALPLWRREVKISVVIPAYNADAFLRQAIDSTLAQTKPAHEIIVVNDGSTDTTHDICLSYGGKIRLIDQVNKGLSEARNTGIRAASGDWIAFLDADDFMTSDRLSKQAAVVEANSHLVLLYSGFTHLFHTGELKAVPAFNANDLWPSLRFRNPILPSTTMIRRSELLSVGGFNNCILEDWDLWLRMIHRYKAASFHSISESLVVYRHVQSSLSKNHLKIARGRMDILDRHLLTGTKGVEKLLLKRKLEAKFFYELAVGMRESGDTRHWEFAIESMGRWPLFGRVVTFRRYKVIASMALSRIRDSFQLLWPVRNTDVI
jgi:glycosyltransferase involved in cell wall biosynthesis